MSAGMTTYRAMADCRSGGTFRRKGEKFPLPTFKKGECPAHLEEVDSMEDAPPAQAGKGRGGRPSSPPKSAQVGKADIGGEKPVSAGDVTSVEMAAKQ